MLLQSPEDLNTPALTIQQHIVVEQQRFPEATGEFSFLLSGLTLATKKIQAQVRSAGINNILGEFGEINIQGESQQILDVYSCLLYTSPSPRDRTRSRMPSSA